MNIKNHNRVPTLKVVELSIVTDIEIEKAINRTQEEGWHFEDIKFVIREASKRPSMAFLFFNRAE